jgi:[acyl-carrier-protein] S-malonyltransferase
LIDHEKIEQFIEIGPGKVLAGLLNRTRKGTPIVSITDVPSLEAAVTALK